MRAGFRCSNPECGVPTIGAAQGHDGVVNVGVAAHITAAAPGGPRFDPTLRAEQRRDQSNGIWLCQTHGKLVDSDGEHFTVTLLCDWKRQAEQRSFDDVLAGPKLWSGRRVLETAPEGPSDERQHQDLEPSVFTRVLGAARTDLAAFQATRSWSRHAISLSLQTGADPGRRQLDAATLGSAVDAFNELVLVAPPGRGKTVTSLQIVEAVLALGESVATFIPLGEWSSQPHSFLESILRRAAFAATSQADLILLATGGQLVLVMDGWNELDAASRRRAHWELAGLKRDLPDLGIIVSTRRQALDVPITGLEVAVGALSEGQQLELARAARGAEGEALLDHAWRTPGLRELVTIPLYLRTLLAHVDGGTLPTTKEEVLRLFVTEYERTADLAERLRDVLFGLHFYMLKAVAVEATRSQNVTVPDARARAVIAEAGAQLVEAGQLASALQPTSVLDILVSHHLLVRSGPQALAFQHQQFQEWYASFHVAELIERSVSGNAGARGLLREVLNVRAWEEAILFACERVSRSAPSGARAVSAAVLEAIAIDPMLAAEMLYRSSEHVWESIKEQIGGFVAKWHVHGTVDRAVRFMIATGRAEFAPQIWPLVSDPNQQIYLSAFRAADSFRPTVLGADAERRLADLPELARKDVLGEVAFRSGMDGMQLATRLARADRSPAVQVSVIEALLFRRADRLAGDVLRRAADEVWRTLAAKGYHARKVMDPNIADRLRREMDLALDSETDPLKKLALLIEVGRDGRDVREQIRVLIEGAEFPGGDPDTSWGLDLARRSHPNEVTSALINRVVAGRDVPYWSQELLRAADVTLDSGPILELLLQRGTERSVAQSAVILAGPEVVGHLIDRMTALRVQLEVPGRPDEAAREACDRLSELTHGASPNSLARAILSRASATAPDEIAFLAGLLASHGGADESDLGVAPDVRQELSVMLARWADVLRASDRTERSHMADVARAMGQVGLPDLVRPLDALLAEELARWRRAHESMLEDPRKRLTHTGDGHMRWTLQYRPAFTAIGDDRTVALLTDYLRDQGPYGFGLDAAQALRSIWTKRGGSAGGRPTPLSSIRGEPFDRRARVLRGSPIDVSHSSPFAEAILGVVEELIADGSGDEAQRRALELAAIGFSMPYGRRPATIERLLGLQQPPAAKQAVLSALAETGEVIPADLVLGGLRELATEASTTKPWLSSRQYWWSWQEWLTLMPFTDRPTDTIAALDLLSRLPAPWEARAFLIAVGRSPDPAATPCPGYDAGSSPVYETASSTTLSDRRIWAEVCGDLS